MVLTLASCGGDNDDGGDAPSVITGTVVEVQTQSLTDVESFVVSQGDERFTIYIGARTNLDFPPAHLNEHRISGDPVRVEVDESGDRLVARTIEDA